MYDLIIIGAGPAGMTAGIYAARSNLKTLIIEKETIGGQISSSPKVENYPGFKEISGMDLANNLFEQATSLGCELEIDEVKKIKDGKVKEVICEYATFKAKAVIIASGAKYRKLGFSNEEDLVGSKVHFCVSCDGAFYKNKNVAIIGGGNTAVGNAIYLADICNKVYLIVRKDYLRCDDALKERINTYKNIEILYNSNIKDAFLDEESKITIIQNGKEKDLQVDGIFESIGMQASTDNFKDLIDTNKDNYFVSIDTLTNKKGIFVAGDCREKNIRQLTTAIADGTIAAINAINYIKKN